MLSDAELTQEFWVEAVDTTWYLVNRLHSSALVDKAPYEFWASKRPSLVNRKVFGCDAFVHVPKEKKKQVG